MCIVQPDKVQGPYLSILLGRLHSFPLTLGTTIEHFPCATFKLGITLFSVSIPRPVEALITPALLDRRIPVWKSLHLQLGYPGNDIT